MAERVGPEWINLQLTRQTVVCLLEIPMAGNKETHLQQHFNTLVEIERESRCEHYLTHTYMYMYKKGGKLHISYM